MIPLPVLAMAVTAAGLAPAMDDISRVYVDNGNLHQHTASSATALLKWDDLFVDEIHQAQNRILKGKNKGNGKSKKGGQSSSSKSKKGKSSKAKTNYQLQPAKHSSKGNFPTGSRKPGSGTSKTASSEPASVGAKSSRAKVEKGSKTVKTTKNHSASTTRQSSSKLSRSMSKKGDSSKQNSVAKSKKANNTKKMSGSKSQKSSKSEKFKQSNKVTKSKTTVKGKKSESKSQSKSSQSTSRDEEWEVLIVKTESPNAELSASPTLQSSNQPTQQPSSLPSLEPVASLKDITASPSVQSSSQTSQYPTLLPTLGPSVSLKEITSLPTLRPSNEPSQRASLLPSVVPSTGLPSTTSSNFPTMLVTPDWEALLAICRCDTGNVCIDDTPQEGTRLRLCFLSNDPSIQTIEINDLMLEKEGLRGGEDYVVDVIEDNVQVIVGMTDGATIACNSAACVVSTLMPTEFYEPDRRSIALAIGKVSLELTGASRLGSSDQVDGPTRLSVNFEKPIELSKAMSDDNVAVPNQEFELEGDPLVGDRDREGDNGRNRNLSLVVGAIVVMSICGGAILAYYRSKPQAE